MNTVFFNRNISDDDRRKQLYQGQLFVYSACESTRALCQHARSLAEEAFAPLDPRDAQHELAVDEYIATLAELKPKFIHHPESKLLIQAILDDLGCDLSKSYFDVPRLRTSTSDGYLTSGLAYAFKPHRDTWYSPPQCQLNWWLPVYEVESDNVMAFHPHYWETPIKNSSCDFNYQDWNQKGRKAAAQQVGTDTRKQSEALEEIELDPQLRIVMEPGGLLIFSAAHMHSSVPNTSGRTRLSIDFRTVHLDDLTAKRSAPNIDSKCTGTTIGDYLSGTDLSRLPDNVISMCEQETAPAAAQWACTP
jgi:hypothetical protein